MFVLLFVYVFGGAIETPGLDYVDFLMPGIIVQSMVFGGFVTALGLAEDLKKGLIDRFRSFSIWGPAVLTGRILADVGTNVIQLVVMFAVGIAVGFRFVTGVPEIVAGVALLLLIGYAFSWVFAFIGLTASSPEASNAYGFTILFPVTFVSSAFVPPDTMPNGSSRSPRRTPSRRWSTPPAPSSWTRPRATTSGARSRGASGSSQSSACCRSGATSAGSPADRGRRRAAQVRRESCSGPMARTIDSLSCACCSGVRSSIVK